MKFFSILVLTYLLYSCSLVTNSIGYSRSPNSVQNNVNCQQAILGFTAPEASSFKNKDSFIYFENFLDKHPDIEREYFFKLSQDSAHANIIDLRSIQEAESMIHAQTYELIPGPLRRDQAEVDFIDGLGRPWDIKTPVTPSYKDDWNFRPEQVFNSLRHQIDMEFAGQKVRILLDFRNIKRKEKKSILNWIESNFSEEEKSRIIHIK